MTVKTYSLKKSGDEKLSNNFRVKEFASHDGADAVLIDDDLVYILQRIRDHFRRPVTISSGYRTPAYNSSIGGSGGSNHTKGKAADIQVKGVSPVLVGMFAETLNAGGIGLYAYIDGGFCHIDTRTTKYRWLTIVRGGENQQISKILPTLKIGGQYNTFNSVKLLQRKLGVSQSGTFGTATQVATSIIDADKPMSNKVHPTMKPVKLIGYLIKNSSMEGDTVLDVFGGSGSTLIACEQLKRNCRTMELDHKYCEVIIKRWETLTGKKAVKL